MPVTPPKTRLKTPAEPRTTRQEKPATRQRPPAKRLPTRARLKRVTAQPRSNKRLNLSEFLTASALRRGPSLVEAAASGREGTRLSACTEECLTRKLAMCQRDAAAHGRPYHGDRKAAATSQLNRFKSATYVADYEGHAQIYLHMPLRL